MNGNPLFPHSDDAPATPAGYVLPRQDKSLISPLSPSESSQPNLAADLIRQKLARIYDEEKEPSQPKPTATYQPLSKHQQLLYKLAESGRSLAEIQDAWHNYYLSLSDAAKHEVWHEFYRAHGLTRPAGATAANQRNELDSKPPASPLSRPNSAQLLPTVQSTNVAGYSPTTLDNRTSAQIRTAIRETVAARPKLLPKHHAQSLAFGLMVGIITVVIFLFGFFNEVVIAPFIQPSRTVGATPIIIDPNAVTTSTSPEIIIPKLNLEIPVDYSQTSTNEATIENALENGIVHYPTTVLPGQKGNAAFFGHSSNNIFNPGKYKFAFVLLHELVPGDTFYLTNNGKVYIYKVYSSQIVDPSDVGVLNDVPNHLATATLITCDPPGTSLHRLVVVADQISPDPSSNSAVSSVSHTTPDSAELPGNGPSLLSRIWQEIF